MEKDESYFNGTDNVLLNEKFNEVSASFVIVPTPSNEIGEYSLEFVLSAVENIGKKLARLELDLWTIK